MSRIRLAAGVIVPVLALCAVPAHAADQIGCRASADRVTTTTPAATAEPVRANPGGLPCSTQSSSALTPTNVGPVVADAVAAFTRLDASGAGALASNAGVTVTLPGLVIRVEALQASAAVVCDNGFTLPPVGSSRVAGLTVNGTPVVVPPADTSVAVPLGPLGSLVLNEEVRDATSITRRALHLTTPLADVVLAEAVAGSVGNPCDALGVRTGPTNGSGGTGTGSATVRPCPSGATYDAANNLCVIERPGKDTIVVGPPYSGPSGGTVVPVDEAIKTRSSRCLKGAGPKFAIIGTAGRDQVTGTNRRDRILVLGGRDNVEGGRGDDCIDGGSGVDTLSGALGKDRIIGGTGGDHLIGGSAADRLEGNSGNDTIHSGFGRDTVMGGTGADKINAATAGPRSKRLDCGKGRDKIRINRNERRTVRGCERVYRIR